MAAIWAQKGFWAFVTASCIRLLLALFGSSSILQHRVELVAPVNSFKRLGEAQWLLAQGRSPYEGWAYHASPLFLHFLQPVVEILNRRGAGISTLRPCTIADIVAAVLLQLIVNKAIEQQNAIDSQAANPSTEAVLLEGDLVEAKNTFKAKREYPEESKPGLNSLGDSVPDPKDRDSLFSKAAGIIFLLNPYTILACLGGSTGPIENCVVLLALYGSSLGNTPLATFGLVVATHLALHPVLLIVPSFLLLHQGLDRRKLSPREQQLDNRNFPRNRKPGGVTGSQDKVVGVGRKTNSGNVRLAVSFLFWLGFWTAILLTVCKALLGKQESLVQMWKATHGFILAADDLTPNIGLFWYFFAEVFDHFRTFFLFVFHYLVLIVLLPPLTIRFHHRPLFLAYVILGLTSIFKPYPSVSDAALYLSLLPAFARELKQMRFVFVGVNALLVASVIGPIMYNLWVWKNVGNANFFYAMTLVYACAQALIVVQSISAMLRFDKLKDSGKPLP